MKERSRITLAIILAAFLAAYFYWFYVPSSVENVKATGEISGILWGDLGKRMIEGGVIDPEKLVAIHESRGDLGELERSMLYGDSAVLTMDSKNSGFVLNLLWALGLANKNPILEGGEMVAYGERDAGRFASTGGWTLSRGSAMDHYSMHELIILSAAEQELVDNVSKNIFRPCCGNSTHFPDCNHGMAMLGLLELLASQGKTEKEMYNLALTANSLWFPDEYGNINKYFEIKGMEKDAKTMLGSAYSSSRGYAKVLALVKPAPQSGGGSCGI